jgi:hypothetical protein
MYKLTRPNGNVEFICERHVDQHSLYDWADLTGCTIENIGGEERLEFCYYCEKEKEPIIGKECADLLEELYSGDFQI